MTFTSLPFSGKTFFADVRANMTDRALFCGTDAEFTYIVVDATFYRFEVFMRPATQMFVASAVAAETARPALRVVASASFVHDYGLAQLPGTGPVAPSFEGEVIGGNQLSLGQPASKPEHRYIGRLAGATAAALLMERGDPSTVATPGLLQEAIGSLLPIIKKGVMFGPKAVYNQDGTLLIARTNMQDWMGRLDGCGKVIVGVHRATDTAFVLVQRDGYTGGESLIQTIIRLFKMGVDDAVMGDGSDSVTLVADATAVLTPNFYKDKSLTTGFAFARSNLASLPGSRLVRDAATTDPRFPAGFQLDVTRAVLSAETGGKALLSLSGLNLSGGGSLSQALSQLQAPLPIALQATTPQLTVANPFSSGGITASLALEPDIAGGKFDGVMVGTIRGTITFPTQQGSVVFRASLPMWFEAP